MLVILSMLYPVGLVLQRATAQWATLEGLLILFLAFVVGTLASLYAVADRWNRWGRILLLATAWLLAALGVLVFSFALTGRVAFPI